MKIIKTILRVRPSSFAELVKLCVTNFWLVWPTYQATKLCMTISTERFARRHYRNGQANAFRHALWNVLIAKKSSKNKSIEKALEWTKAITDWHEKAFFSKELPMKMDYHNNEIGRNLFANKPHLSHDEYIQLLLKYTENSQQITNASDLNQYKNQLVHITNDT